MRARSPEGNGAALVDLRQVASAIPPIGLAPDAVARADLRSGALHRSGPALVWVWQHGSMLIVLDALFENTWQLSELSFDDTYGYYLEQRRSDYVSPREATGVAIAWSMRMGTVASLSAAASLDAWSSFTFA